MRDTATQLTFSVVPPQVLDVVWPDAKKMLQMAVDTTSGVYNIDNVYDALKNQTYLLWVALDGATPVAAITTRIAIYPNAKGLAMDWIGGKRMRDWFPLAHETLSNYARQNGCTHMEGYGRRAWGRWLEKYGWKPEYIAYRMELSE